MKNKTKLWVRIGALVMAGCMVLGSVLTAIFFIFGLL